MKTVIVVASTLIFSTTCLADKKMSEYEVKPTPAANDRVLIYDSQGGGTKAATFGALPVSVMTQTQIDAYLNQAKAYTDAAVLSAGAYNDGLAQDAAGAMFSGNSEAGIAITYNSTTKKINASVDFSSLSSTYQPLNSGLTVLSALTTTSFGRGMLTYADAPSARSALGITSLLAGKQDALVNQSTIKSINNTSLLGAGNINVSTMPSGSTNGDSLRWDNGAWVAGSVGFNLGALSDLTFNGRTAVFIEEQASDPTTTMTTGQVVASRATGDLFIKTSTGTFVINATYTAD